MLRTSLVLAAAALAAAVAALGALAAGDAKPSAQAAPHAHTVLTATKASDLRVTLNRLLGEHVYLAVAATQSGYSGQKDFPALAKALDRNSVAVADAIGSVYGKQARNAFLNGKLLWRDHIRFFVDYTVALAKKDTAGQDRAVGNLKGYVEAFSLFLAKATGLPQAALRAGVLEHVMQLKGQLDAYAAGDYAKAARLTRAAYAHMGMTGDALAGAIVKKFPRKLGA
jgi:hypothetical protein